MSRTQALIRLEALLESFLDRAVRLKESRLKVIDGISRLDDIAASFTTSDDLAEEVGEWFARHSDWLNSEILKPADRGRISGILAGIKGELTKANKTSAAETKIAAEIDRFTARTAGTTTAGTKLILKRGPETVVVKRDSSDSGDTITPFTRFFENMGLLFAEVSASQPHLLSALDEALKKATLQLNKEALILSGLIIYYLKQNGYKVEPYVSRLKEAERQQKDSV